MQSVLIVFISGLGSERTGPGAVFREWGERAVARLGAEAEAMYVSYSTPRIAEVIAERAAGFEKLALVGHSDGGSMVKGVADAFARWRRAGGREVVVDLAVMLDPAPDFARGQVYFWQLAQWFEWARWELPVAVVRKAVCFYQRKQSVMGVVGLCGCPIRTVAGRHTNTDVTEWGLGHNEIVGDARIQEIVNGLLWDVASFEEPVLGGHAL